MSYTPQVGDRVRVTRNEELEGEVTKVFTVYGEPATVHVRKDNGVVREVSGAYYNVEKLELALQAGDVVLFYGDTRVRNKDGNWIAHNGVAVGHDSTYTNPLDKSSVRFLVRGGKVVE